MWVDVDLELDTLIMRYAEFWAQDVGAEVAVEAASVCGNPLDPFFVARFPAWEDAMGDHGRDGNAGIHAERARWFLFSSC